MKQEFIRDISDSLHITQRDARRLLETVLQTIKIRLKEHGKVTIDGLGTIKVSERKGNYKVTQKDSNNVYEGEYKIKTASLKPSKKLRNFLNS